MLPTGYKKIVVRNLNDVDLLLMHTDVYAAEIAHNVSSRKRVAIIEKARKLNVKVTNGDAKVRTQE